jgi:hypothetical protein
MRKEEVKTLRIGIGLSGRLFDTAQSCAKAPQSACRLKSDFYCVMGCNGRKQRVETANKER